MSTFTPYAVVSQPSIKDLIYRGLASALGGPVDLATMAMRPFSYVTPEKQVVGGSEWIGKKLEDAGLVSTARAPWQELAASMVSPSGAAKGAAVGLGKMGALGMTAWHGSPHKFDKFDLSKIGTGEGAQSYGHGAYLAEAKKVGEEYKERLSGANTTLFELGGEKVGSIGDNKKALIRKAKELGYSPEAAVLVAHELRANQGNLEVVGAKYGWLDDPLPVQVEAEKLVREMQYLPEGGYLYKTDIPDEAVARMLDWDKPMNQQTPFVLNALKKAGVLKDDGSIPFMYKEFPATGGEMYERLTSPLAEKVTGFGPGSQNASAFLLKHGILGNRYLDQGSRGADAGTSNFVIFNPDMIRILERNEAITGTKPWLPGEYKLPSK